MDDDKVIQVETRKYFALLFFNAAREFMESAKADFAAKRYLTVLASQRRFLEYSRRAAWLSYFATEEEVVYAQNNPDAKDPKPFPELQNIDVLMRQFVGLDGLSALGVHVNNEGTTFMQLLHQFTHGGVRSILALNAGFNESGIANVLEQNTRDLRSIACFVIACNVGLPRDALKIKLSTIKDETEQKQLLSQLYEDFKIAIPADLF